MRSLGENKGFNLCSFIIIIPVRLGSRVIVNIFATKYTSLRKKYIICSNYLFLLKQKSKTNKIVKLY